MSTARRFALTVLLAGFGLAVGLILLAPQVQAVVTAGKSHGTDLARLRELSQRSTVLARDGSLLAVLHDEENRSPVPLEQVPLHVQRAIIDVEDARFWQHGGVDLRSMVRALTRNVEGGDVLQGGSTITQQLVKNALLTPTKKLDRKIKEAVIAMRLEDQMDKEEILERYLNTVYFGNSAYGIQAAAETYFGTDVGGLTVGDAALLAGLIRNPVGNDPIKHAAAARERRDIVLDRMVSEHHLSPTEAKRLKLTPIPRELARPVAPPTDYFVEAVKLQLLKDTRLGATPQERYNAVFKGGLQIITTLDPRLQQLAREKVDAILPDTQGKFTAAVATVDPHDGAVRAIVGGRDFQQSEVNLALGAAGGGTGRQPGSAFKPFVLIAALEDGFGPSDIVNGASPCRVKFKGEAKPYEPGNYEGSSGGVMTIEDATVHSVNCAYANIAAEVGIDKVVDVAHRMGITSHLDPFPSTSLGTEEVSPLEMASAYSTMAADGVHYQPFFVQKVVDRYGKVLLEQKPEGEQVISAQNARVAVQVLRTVVDRGTGTRARLRDRQVFGKTGTSNKHQNAWFVGGTPQLVTAVWMGDPKAYTSMLNVGGVKVAGGTYPARIWGAFMGDALEGQPALKFPAPNPALIPRGKSIMGATVPTVTVPTLPEVTIVVPEVPQVTLPEWMVRGQPPPGAPGGGTYNPPQNQQPGNNPRPEDWPEDWDWP